MSNKFINNLRKGENFELRTELNSEYRERRKEAVRRVIANMTIGKDVSDLFTDVLKNMQTDDLEIKKLIYLYLMSYAREKPDLVILAINTFVRDSEDNNPLLRALAIRTMGCLHVLEILDYISEPLLRCLKDRDAYVRKTAVVCVAKIYELSKEAAIDQGLVDIVVEMLSDSNALVVANAVSSLREINDTAKANGQIEPVWSINDSSVVQLLKVLNDNTEWGQISILEALVDYKPTKNRAIKICDATLPRLQHANSGVVLAAIRLILEYERYIQDNEITSKYNKKLIPPLISLLSTSPEIQYVALRSISLVLKKHPLLLSKEINMFFLKYNDPDYIKFEKLDLLVNLCTDANVEKLLSELTEYSKEVDSSVCRRSITAIERLALKFSDSAEKCLEVLIEIIELKGVYAVQQSAIAICNIARTFTHLGNGKIARLAVPALYSVYDLLDTDPNSKSSFIFMIGEYSSVSPDIAYELLERLEPELLNEEESVQLSIVHASVSFFLRSPGRAQQIVLKILQKAFENCSSMDVRDVSLMYWRLLSSNPEMAKQIVLAKKPSIDAVHGSQITPKELESYLTRLGCVSSVTQTMNHKFLPKKGQSTGYADVGLGNGSGGALDSSSSNNMADNYGQNRNNNNDDNADEEPELLISF
ncbi:AP-2 complex subunit beta [Smittium culicis]|uniref:AP complex subunit beta n=1 Tax=Smittium culicis TaxID=133412 RepID=A0A1R1XTC8_9FUNG|nr:AP-2 complex subunit beta [Smittium culicis]